MAVNIGATEHARDVVSAAPAAANVATATTETCAQELAPNSLSSVVRAAVDSVDENALSIGTRSVAVRNALAPATRAIETQVTTDLGGDTDALPATLQRLVAAFAETTLLRESVFIRMEGRPVSAKGHTRRMVGAYLQLVDRELRLAQAIGLERKAKRVPSLVELVRQRSREQEQR